MLASLTLRVGGQLTVYWKAGAVYFRLDDPATGLPGDEQYAFDLLTPCVLTLRADDSGVWYVSYYNNTGAAQPYWLTMTSNDGGTTWTAA